MAISIPDYMNTAQTVASLFMSLLAIWLSLEFYHRSKGAEKRVEIALERIDSRTEALNAITSKLLNKLAASATSPRQMDEHTKVVTDIFGDMLRRYIPVQNAGGEQPASENTDRWRLVNLIVADYYCSIANMSSQQYLPVDRVELAQASEVAQIINMSKNDHDTLKTWLSGETRVSIEATGLENLYDMSRSWDVAIRDVDEVYSARESTEASATT